jgi:hypothetical protein
MLRQIIKSKGDKNMENVTKINTTEKKPNIFKRGIDAWKRANEKHPVATKIITGAAVATAVVGGTAIVTHFVNKAHAASEAANLIPADACGIDNINPGLPDELGFDCVKMVNKNGDVLVESIVDMGSDYEVAGELNAENIIREIGDMDLVTEIVNKITDEAANVTEAVADAAI